MADWIRHVDEPPPELDISLVQGGERFERLPSPLFYAVQWALDRSLFSQPFGRSAANFYPLDLADASGYSRYEVARVRLSPRVWERFTRDPNQRHLYVRFGAGDELDDSHSTWDWSRVFTYLLNHDPEADAGADAEVSVSDGSLQQAAELDGSGTTDPDPGASLNYRWFLIDGPTVDLTRSANRGFVTSMAKRVSKGSGPRVTAVPKGATVPPGARGTYRFKLEVTDDDVSTYYGNRGRDEDDTTIAIGESAGAGGVSVLSPTSDRQVHVERPTDDRVSIEYEIGPDLYRELEQQHGFFMLELLVRHSERPGRAPVYDDVTRGKPPRRGQFTWHLYDVDGLRTEPGPYDVSLSVVGARDFGLLTVDGFSTSTTEEKALYLDPFRFWADLVSFRPPASVQRALHNDPDISSGQFQPVEDAIGPINLDYYPVRIDAFPTIQGQTFTPSDLVEYVRLNINSLQAISGFSFAPTTFTPWNARHRRIWQSSSPVGTFLFLDLTGPENASVVCTYYDATHWRFSTTYTDSWYSASSVEHHPVSGNREWGIFKNDRGTYMFYTRAADRTLYIDHPSIGYGVGDVLWRGLQAGVAKFVNSNGGSATVETPITLRPAWPDVAQCCHNPTRSWLYQ